MRTYRPPAKSKGKSAAKGDPVPGAIARSAKTGRFVGERAGNRTTVYIEGRMLGELEQLARKRGKQSFHYATFARSNVLERIDVVRRGVPPGVVAVMADDLGVEQGYLIDHLGLARSTIARKVKGNVALSTRESESVLGVAQLVGLVETMMAESGGPDGFDSAAWVGQWIARPHPALGNRRPVELLDTTEGQRLVTSILQQSQSGAYA